VKVSVLSFTVDTTGRTAILLLLPKNGKQGFQTILLMRIASNFHSSPEVSKSKKNTKTVRYNWFQIIPKYLFESFFLVFSKLLTDQSANSVLKKLTFKRQMCL
jgi:hypothetical protein